jgi:hypothetical protein
MLLFRLTLPFVISEQHPWKINSKTLAFKNPDIEKMFMSGWYIIDWHFYKDWSNPELHTVGWQAIVCTCVTVIMQMVLLLWTTDRVLLEAYPDLLSGSMIMRLGLAAIFLVALLYMIYRTMTLEAQLKPKESTQESKEASNGGATSTPSPANASGTPSNRQAKKRRKSLKSPLQMMGGATSCPVPKDEVAIAITPSSKKGLQRGDSLCLSPDERFLEEDGLGEARVNTTNVANQYVSEMQRVLKWATFLMLLCTAMIPVMVLPAVEEDENSDDEQVLHE